MNNTTFAGRLGRDATTRTVGDTTATSFALAVDDYFKGEKLTQWVDCTIWGERGQRLADVLVKGKQVTVRGKVGLRTYQSNAGEFKATLTLNVADITLQGGGQSEGAPRREPAATQPARQASQPPATTAPASDFSDDDIPF